MSEINQEGLREQIARELYEQEFSAGYWDTRMSNGDKVKWLAKADCIISLLARSNVAIIKDKQALPKIDYAARVANDIAKIIQEEMVEAGFVQVERIKE